MLEGITSWIEDKATGYLKTGIQAGGSLAGNAVGSVGGLVESAGRSAGDTVSGSIGGVGGTINGYGDTVKRSMSADGPVSSAPKKTAVKPPSSGPQKPAAAQKALPSAGAKRPPGAAGTAQKSTSIAQRAPGPRPVPAKGTAAPASKYGAPAARPAGGVSSTRTTSGKVMPSAASRPGYKKPAVGTKAATSSAYKSHSANDPIGIGKNFGDISKTKPQSSNSYTNKGQSKPPGKPSAADPLAIGEDIGNIGKKK